MDKSPSRRNEIFKIKLNQHPRWGKLQNITFKCHLSCCNTGTFTQSSPPCSLWKPLQLNASGQTHNIVKYEQVFYSPISPKQRFAYFLNMLSHCNAGLIAEAMSWAGGGCQQSTHHQETMLEFVENYPDNYVSCCFTMEHKNVVLKIQGKLSKSTCFSYLYQLPQYTVYRHYKWTWASQRKKSIIPEKNHYPKLPFWATHTAIYRCKRH